MHHRAPRRSVRGVGSAIVFMLVLVCGGVAHGTLAPGDIAIIGYQSSDPDMLAFVALTTIPQGEVIRFTDSGWQAAGGFRANEGGVQYTAAGAIPAGTVITRANPFTSGEWTTNNAGVGSGGFLLALAGDQILAFEGAAASPTFIYAINNSTAGWSDATSAQTTAIPTGLSDGDTAVNIGAAGMSNGYYNGPTTGTPAALRAAIGNPANWLKSNSIQTWPSPWTFVVTGGGGPNPPSAYAGANRTLLFNGGTLPIVMTNATANDADGLMGLTYEWTPVTGTGIVGWNSSRTGNVVDVTSPADAVVTVNAAGVYMFTLTVTDPTALTATSNVTITVSNAPPPGQYDPPPNYYNNARPGGQWLTGTSLKPALNGIISVQTVRSYDDAKQALQILDLDQSNTSNLILIYTGNSVPKTWDAGVTWNREHQWPQNWFPSGTPLTSDLFHLRPCDPGVNSSRGDQGYGIGSGFWDPNQGGIDRGACARALFYVATRYTNLTLANGPPANNQMGDLARLLEWHYAYPVSTSERRRNHLIYSSADNPSYYQGNRNPYIDYPELVWTVYATTPNNAEVFLGATPPADGASSANVDLGRIIVNAAVPVAQNVTLNKTGTDPTTYDINLGGSAASMAAGARQAFAGGTQSRAIDAGLNASTGIAGHISGTITVDDTELTSAGAGKGSADGNDVITVTLDVLDHANASFASPADQNGLTINFGSFAAGSGIHMQSFSVYNLAATAGLTAGLNLDSISGTGNTSTLQTNLAPFTNEAAGTSRSFTASLDASTAGTFSATYTLNVSDENIPGAAAGTALTLTLTGQATPSCRAADANCDNVVNANDVGPFVQLLLVGGSPCSVCAGDSNGDQVIDGGDIGLFVAALMGP